MVKFSLITGATGGLGRAFVFECANRGDNLVLTGTNQTKLENITNEVVEKFPNIQVISKTCDLSSLESRNDFFEYLKTFLCFLFYVDSIRPERSKKKHLFFCMAKSVVSALETFPKAKV